MTVPNVTIGWCRKRAICKWCEQTIEIGKPILKVFFWNKGNENSRRWNTQHCYHWPKCYVKQGNEYLGRNPFIPHIRGRKSLLTEEDRRKRFLLIRKFNELYQRKVHITIPFPDSLTVEVNLTQRMAKVMLEVAKLGGIPKSWSEKIQ